MSLFLPTPVANMGTARTPPSPAHNWLEGSSRAARLDLGRKQTDTHQPVLSSPSANKRVARWYSRNVCCCATISDDDHLNRSLIMRYHIPGGCICWWSYHITGRITTFIVEQIFNRLQCTGIPPIFFFYFKIGYQFSTYAVGCISIFLQYSAHVAYNIIIINVNIQTITFVY